MPEIAEREKNEEEDFLTYVKRLGEGDISQMLSTRVIPSFLGAVSKHGIHCFSQEALTYWAVEMMIQGMKSATVNRYLGTLHTLYKSWSGTNVGMASESGENVENRREEIKFAIPEGARCEDSDIEKVKQIKQNLKTAINLSKSSKNPKSREYTYINALQYLLINPGASLSDAVTLKFSDSESGTLHIEDIKLSMRKAPQAKYVFPLEQGKKREGAIIRDLLGGLHTAARGAGFEFGTSFSRDSLTALWIGAAIREGIPLKEIRAIIHTLPTPYKFLSVVPASIIDDDRKIEILNKVATNFFNRSTSWYVMRMRSGVTPGDITRELKEQKFPLLSQIEFYYPMRKIKKLKKQRAVFVEVPVLPGILFFRMQYDKISNMMAMISDLGWCYKTTSSPSSTYSSIPQREMRAFQRCVGALTSDIKMEIITSQPPLNIGDEVVIENGTPLDGQHAVIRKIRNVNGTLTYTLRLSDSEFIHWQEVSLPGVSLTKK